MKLSTLIFLSLLCFLFACTPKTTEQVKDTTTTQPTKPTAKKPLSTCLNWLDAPNIDEIREKHVLYRDKMKFIRTEQSKGAEANQDYIKKNYVEAFKLWEKAYTMAPAADGLRAVHFDDGILIYTYFFQNPDVKPDITKEVAIKKIMELYDKRAECYGEEGYIAGRKGFDYYYKYPDQATSMEKYNYFKQSMDIDGDSTQYFVLNPFTALISELMVDEKIPMQEAQKYQKMIMARLEKGLKECKNTKECEPWKIIEGYVPARFEQLEGIKNFYDCEYYKEKYYAQFEADPKNCEVIEEVLSRLRWGGCELNSPELTALTKAYNTDCRVVTEPGPLRQAADALQEGRFKEAIDAYEEFINKTDDQDKKAKYTLRVAKIYYVHLKNFSRARSKALEAAEMKSNWGEPYMLIGRLYASSGPLCGPGRGWDSQIVTWPAIDMWSKAKRIDSDVAAEANKFINRYSKFMPTIEDVFQRGLKEGDSFRVGCWINETTTIRVAR